MFRKSYLFILLLSVTLAGAASVLSCTRGEEKENKPEKSAEAAPEPTAGPTRTKENKKNDDAELSTILTRYYDAIGGRENWEQVEAIKYTGNMQSMGKQFKAALVYERPDKCRIDFSVGNIYFIQAYDGESAWKFNPTTKDSKPEYLTGEDADDLKETCDFDGPLIDHENKGYTIDYMGRENVEGKDAYKLKITFDTGNIDYYYLASETYLPFLVKGTTTFEGKETGTTTTIDEYIDTGGLILPYYVKFDMDDVEGSEIFTVSTIEVNPEIEENVFTFPRRIEDSY
ncbi:MAG: hypothetical protein RIG61_07505 [Deltaproteobacteria bacterium]